MVVRTALILAALAFVASGTLANARGARAANPVTPAATSRPDADLFPRDAGVGRLVIGCTVCR